MEGAQTVINSRQKLLEHIEAMQAKLWLIRLRRCAKSHSTTKVTQWYLNPTFT
jgi:uncharacterized Zn finger protein